MTVVLEINQQTDAPYTWGMGPTLTPYVFHGTRNKLLSP